MNKRELTIFGVFMVMGLSLAAMFGPNDKVTDPDFDKECIKKYVDAERAGNHANKVDIYLKCVNELENR